MLGAKQKVQTFLVGSSLSVMAIKVKQQLAYGSSCSTGGVFQGRAEGNAINIGDAVEVWEDMDVFREGPVQKPVKAKSTSTSPISIHLISTSPSLLLSPMSPISANVKSFKMLLVVDPETIHPFDVSLLDFLGNIY